MCKSLQIISPTISWSVFLMEKMFVGLSCSWKMFKLITNRIKQKYPEKSRTISKKSWDKNMTQIPSRKIPGSRDFAKIPSQKSRDLNFWERWGLVLCNASTPQCKKIAQSHFSCTTFTFNWTEHDTQSIWLNNMFCAVCIAQYAEQIR